MTIRRRLLILILALLIPVLLAVLAGVRFLYEGQRAALERGVHEAVRALTMVVEREIAQTVTGLEVMATSSTLQRGDLAGFHARAREFASGWETTIVYASLDGQQLVNTRRPYGSPLPRVSPELARVRASAGPLATITSDLYFAPIGQQWSFAVQVPVRDDGRLIGHLSMGGFSNRLQKALAQQALPEGWVGTVLDRQYRVVARSRNPDAWVGKLSTPDHIRALSGKTFGQFKATTLDGTPAVGIFNRSQELGWTIVVAVPEEEIASEARDATMVLMLLSLALLALGATATLLVARHIVRPVRRLVVLAGEIGAGREIGHEPPSGLAEVDGIAQALADASRRIAGARAELEQEVQKARAEAALAHANALQAQKLEALGRLTGGVAHDFNNLLMVISSNAHVLGRRLPPEWREAPQLLAVERSVRTGKRLTRQLLAFARRQPLRIEQVRLDERLAAMTSLLRTAVRSSVSLSCTVAPDTWPIEVDAGEFELSMLNLAVNANDAMPSGGVLEIRAGNLPDTGDGRHVQIEVRDSGSGIPPEILDKVCEPFFTTKPPGHGTGLGLSQVYGFCNQAGGTLHIDSTPGQGTTVRLRLKASADPAPQAERPGAPMPALAATTVLLVEDNEELREATAELLRSLGCTVEVCASADAARQWLDDDRRVDLVLSDIRMPGQLDGLGLAAWLRRWRPALPLVLMTGYTEELRAGRVDGHVVLAKPVEPEALGAALRAALATRG